MQSRGQTEQHYKELKGAWERLAFTCTCSSRRPGGPCLGHVSLKRRGLRENAAPRSPALPAACSRHARPGREAFTAQLAGGAHAVARLRCRQPAPGRRGQAGAGSGGQRGAEGAKTRAGDRGRLRGPTARPGTCRWHPIRPREEPPPVTRASAGAVGAERHDSQRRAGPPRWATPSAEGRGWRGTEPIRSPAGGHRRGRPPAAGA